MMRSVSRIRQEAPRAMAVGFGTGVLVSLFKCPLVLSFAIIVVVSVVYAFVLMPRLAKHD